MNKRTSIFAAFLMLIFMLSWQFTALAQEQIVFLPQIFKNSGGTIPQPTATATATATATPMATATPTSVPAWPDITLDPVAEGMNQPIHVTNAGDGSNRLFVAQREGRIRIIDGNGQLQTTPFLNIEDRVECCDSELGLFAVAFSPNYTTTQHFYVHYTALINSQAKSRISRFTTTADPNVADPNSEEIVLEFDQPAFNHNGGQIAFGPDGYLYIATGDGGGSGDPQDNGQKLTTLLGKILRIDVETGSPATYTIPANNPFVGTAGARGEIWAYGLRNPWRFSFDRTTGDLYIGDVGQGRLEEISFQPASSTGGENYGWNTMEGSLCFNATTCDQTGLTLPIHTYGRSLGQSVTGGNVYRGSQETTLQGIYFFADYITGRIWGLRNVGGTWEDHEFTNSPYNVASFGEDENGELYIVDLGGGVYKVRD